MEILFFIIIFALAAIFEYFGRPGIQEKLGISASKNIPSQIKVEYHEILSRYSTYYNKLNHARQKEFRERLYKLLSHIGFSSAEYKTVSREMRAVIGCAIIEITFGLKNFLPAKFSQVFVKPRRYMYPGFSEPFLGHVDFKHGIVCFSWPDVQHGYLVPDDALNVALHEMAHVIEHEHEFAAIFDSFFDQVDWLNWTAAAKKKIVMIRNEENTFLKNYGGQNEKEVFAVAIEAFFEQPEMFKEALPNIYQKLVNLLKQDPTIEGDPVLGR